MVYSLLLAVCVARSPRKHFHRRVKSIVLIASCGSSEGGTVLRYFFSRTQTTYRIHSRTKPCPLGMIPTPTYVITIPGRTKIIGSRSAQYRFISLSPLQSTSSSPVGLFSQATNVLDSYARRHHWKRSAATDSTSATVISRLSSTTISCSFFNMIQFRA